MTREEAREFLINISYKLGNMSVEYLSEKDGEKMREAIEALEQEPFINKHCVSSGVCEHDKQNALEKIRAEIESYKLSEDKLSDMDEDSVKWGMKIAYDIVDKYKAESEE